MAAKVNNWQDYKDQLRLKNEALVHPKFRGKSVRLFKTVSYESTEIEYLDFLYGLVRAIKPRHVLETGTHEGLSAIAIGFALRENSFHSFQKSKIITLEKKKRFAESAGIRIKKSCLDKFVTIVLSDSLVYLGKQPVSQKYDLVYFDSSRLTRVKEFEILHKRRLLKEASYLIFHDTSEDPVVPWAHERSIQKAYLKAMKKVRQHCLSCLALDLSRGMTICRYSLHK